MEQPPYTNDKTLTNKKKKLGFYLFLMNCAFYCHKNQHMGFITCAQANILNNLLYTKREKER